MSNFVINKGDLHGIKITTGNGSTTEITPLVNTIVFYESIFSPTITCNMEVVDGANFYDGAKLTGGEEVRVSLGDRTGSKKLNKTFHLSSVFNRVQSNIDTEIYGLSLITDDLLLDSSRQVHKSYTGNISEIVGKVSKEFLTYSKLTLDSTNGVQTLLGNGVSPLAFLKRCCEEANSLEYPDSVYLFFENMDGHFFKTLGSLYAQDAKHTYIYDLAYMSLGTPGVQQASQKYLTSIQHTSSGFDLLAGRMEGQHGSTTLCFDPLRKKIKSFEYSHSKEPKKLVNSKTLDKFLSKPSVRSYMIGPNEQSNSEYIKSKDPESYNNFRRKPSALGAGIAQISNFKQNMLNVTIPGNPEIRAGDAINIIVPSKDSSKEGKMKNSNLMSGKYLVGSVANRIDAFSNDYHTSLDIMRPEYSRSM